MVLQQFLAFMMSSFSNFSVKDFFYAMVPFKIPASRTSYQPSGLIK